jgi:hypothetical protein
MALNLNDKHFKKVPIAEITTPKAGKICKGGAWYVTDGENVFQYKGTSWQCNANKDVVKHLYPNEQIIYIEMAFVEHNCRDYVM